jgi:hypothetical protein
VLDEEMSEQRPLLRRKELHQILLDLYRIAVFRECQPLAQSSDVGVDDHSLVAAERVPENDVRRLAANAR